MLDAREETRRAAAALIDSIDRLTAGRPVRLMEVCGTHTVAIFRAGIRQLLPPQVEVVSGPGCPVCVTPNDYLDTAIAYARQKDVIVVTFGDMLRVPGSTSSLSAVQAEGGDVRVAYSPLDGVRIAAKQPDKRVIFLAVGFETTAPTAAAAVLAAEAQGLQNFFVLSAHKLVPPALRALLADAAVRVDGFLLPGHVCAITGEAPFGFLAREHGLPAVVAGFEPLDILQAVYLLVRQLHDGAARLENAYKRVVPPDGNPAARAVLARVYETADANWRGIGAIPESGLRVNAAYRRFDAAAVLPVEPERTAEHPACRCGEILRGLAKPFECPLFGKACLPEHPIGSCMVSVEGACAAWYKYGSGRYQGYEA